MENRRNEEQPLLGEPDDSAEMTLNLSMSNAPLKGQRAHFRESSTDVLLIAFFNSQLETQLFIIWFPRKGILFSYDAIQ